MHVGGDMKLLVGGEDGPGKLEVAVEDERRARVAGDDHLSVKRDRIVNVGGAVGLEAGAGLAAKVSLDVAVQAGSAISAKAGTELGLQAGSTLELKVGGSSISMTPSGIWISATVVNINSGAGPAVPPVACDPGTATVAEDAAPADPAAADDAKSGQKSS